MKCRQCSGCSKIVCPLIYFAIVSLLCFLSLLCKPLLLFLFGLVLHILPFSSISLFDGIGCGSSLPLLHHIFCCSRSLGLIHAKRISVLLKCRTKILSSHLRCCSRSISLSACCCRNIRSSSCCWLNLSLLCFVAA